MALIYISERPGGSPDLTVKAVGHQWYWSYENDINFGNAEVDSYIIPTDSLSVGDFRLLEADNALVLPYSSKIRLVTSSTDVIHSWALPAISLKVDCVPGRLNTL